MTFAQRLNRLTTHFSERIPVVKRRMTVFTYILTPWRRVLFEKMARFQLVKKFPAFYETRRFITTFTRVRHLSLFSVRSIQPMPPIPLLERSFSLLSSIYEEVFQVVSFPQVSLAKVCIHLSSPPYVLHAPPTSFVSI